MNQNQNHEEGKKEKKFRPNNKRATGSQFMWIIWFSFNHGVGWSEERRKAFADLEREMKLYVSCLGWIGREAESMTRAIFL
jgi:ammonia channel protein AmtB